VVLFFGRKIGANLPGTEFCFSANSSTHAADNFRISRNFELISISSSAPSQNMELETKNVLCFMLRVP